MGKGQGKPAQSAGRHRGLQSPVSPIAQRLITGVLATTEPNLLRFRCLVLHGRELSPLVGTIAKRLLAAAPAAAPPIGLARLDVNAERGLTCDNGVRHARNSCNVQPDPTQRVRASGPIFSCRANRRCAVGGYPDIDERSTKRQLIGYTYGSVSLTVPRPMLRANLIKILDDLVPAALLKAVYEDITVSAYGCGGRSNPKDQFPFWVARITVEDLATVAAFKQLWHIIEENITHGDYEPYHILVNANTFGDCPTVHTDLPTENSEDHYTLLYFAHLDWHYDWSGETVLYNAAKDDIVKSIYPRPGRILAFDSRIPHVARTPTRICPSVRFSIAFKLRPKGFVQDQTGESVASP